jgi:hypothetical protein
MAIGIKYGILIKIRSYYYVNRLKTSARPAAHQRDCGSFRASKGFAQGTASLVALGYKFIDRKLYGIDGLERARE